MGNQPSDLLQSDSRYCKGRDDIIGAVQKFIEGKNGNVVAICGPPKIGKSVILIKTFMTQQKAICKDVYMIYYNFEDCAIFSFQQAEEKWITNIQDLHQEAENNVEDHTDYKQLLSTLVTANKRKTVYLYLDNVDVVNKWGDTKFATFLEFVKFSVQTHNNLKIVFSTSTQVPQSKKWPEIVKVPPLPLEYMCEIITSECDENKLDIEESQRLYIPLIGTLCDGIPYAAATAASILSENDGLFKPSELLELMIVERLDVLSPSNYPSSSRLDAMIEPISDKALKTEVKEFLSNLIKKITTPEFSEEEARTFNGDLNATSAMFKKSVLRPLLTSFILAKGQDFVLPTVFKECKIAIDKRNAEESHGVNSDEVKQLKQCQLDVIKDHIRRLNLELEVINELNQRELEKVIQSLAKTEPTHEDDAPEEEDDDESFGREIQEETGLFLGDSDHTDNETPKTSVRHEGDGAAAEMQKEQDQSSMYQGLSMLTLDPADVDNLKPAVNVRYTGNGDGLEFQQRQPETIPKQVFESDTDTVVYDRFENIKENSFDTTLKIERSENHNDLIEKETREQRINNCGDGGNLNVALHGLAALAIATTPDVVINGIGRQVHTVNGHLPMENQPLVRGEVLSLQSSGPNALSPESAESDETVPIKKKTLKTQSSDDSGICSPGVNGNAPVFLRNITNLSG